MSSELLYQIVKNFRVNVYTIVCFMVLSLFFTVRVKAQTLKDSVLNEKFQLYSKAHPSNLLFVHTDKTTYTNNETIWFCGYLVKNEATNIKDHTLMSVALIKEDAGEVNFQVQYLMHQGLSFGSFTLPDSIVPGNYQFIAYTNMLNSKGEPLALFTQSITIKSITYQDFKAELDLLDTVATADFVRARLTVAIKDYDKKEKKNVSIAYTVGKYPGRSTILKNGENNTIITIPKSQLSQIRPTLFTSVNYKNKTQHLSIRLPEPKQGIIKVRFFPEGGNLTEGLENVIAWEAKNSYEQPIAVTGIVYHDERPIDTISTNSYGIGKFKLTPNSKSQYTFKIFANSYLNRDSVYTLPPVLENNIILHLPHAIVNDTLRLRLLSKTPKVVQIIVHDFKNIYSSFFTRVAPAKPVLSLILGSGVPKGLTTVTILDTAARPLAECVFFAHYDQKINVEWNLDKASYKTKDSVHLSIKLSDSDGRPAQGVVSLAAVQDNRIEGSKYQDIENYVYLTHNLEVLPQDPQGKGLNNKEYLEDILRTRGWRRYTWKDLISCTPADTVLKMQSPVIQLKVRHFTKTPKKPVDILFMRDSAIAINSTDTSGTLQLTNSNALIVEGRTLFLSANSKEKEDYSLKVENPFIAINETVASSTEWPVLGLVRRINSNDFTLKGMSHAIALKEVTIKASDDNSIYKGNECGDYVCMYNILNCPRHYYTYGNRPPVKGKLYLDWREVDRGNRVTVEYTGCRGDSNRGTLIGEGIYTAREFYGVNMDDTGLLEPQFISTLMWQPGLVVNNEGEIHISFATGDITGKFRLVVQGLGTQDVIFGEDVFMVK